MTDDRNRNPRGVPLQPEPEPWSTLSDRERSSARRYRVTLLEGGRPVTDKRDASALVLDFTPGRWAADARIQLDNALRGLLAQSKLSASKHRECCLEVADWDTGLAEFRWPVTWDPEARRNPR